MALFKKLNEELKKTEVKTSAINISEVERKELEADIIFGGLLESLDIDIVEQGYEELEEGKASDYNRRRVMRKTKDPYTDSEKTEAGAPVSGANTARKLEPPEEIGN